MNADGPEEREADRLERDTYDHDEAAAQADERRAQAQEERDQELIDAGRGGAAYLAHWLDRVQT